MSITVFEGGRSSQEITWLDGEKRVILRHYRVAEGRVGDVSYVVITPSSPGGPGLWVTSRSEERMSIQVLVRLPVEENGVGTRALPCVDARKWCEAVLRPLGWVIGEDFVDEDDLPPQAA